MSTLRLCRNHSLSINIFAHFSRTAFFNSSKIRHMCKDFLLVCTEFFVILLSWSRVIAKNINHRCMANGSLMLSPCSNNNKCLAIVRSFSRNEQVGKVRKVYNTQRHCSRVSLSLYPLLQTLFSTEDPNNHALVYSQ